MSTSEIQEALQTHLFSDPEHDTYAILDGASIPGLLQSLFKHQPDSCCLYRGELTPDLAECAYAEALEELRGCGARRRDGCLAGAVRDHEELLPLAEPRFLRHGGRC